MRDTRCGGACSERDADALHDFLCDFGGASYSYDYDVVGIWENGWCGGGVDYCTEAMADPSAPGTRDACWDMCAGLLGSALVAADWYPHTGECCCQDACECVEDVGEIGENLVRKGFDYPDDDCPGGSYSYGYGSYGNYSDFFRFGGDDDDLLCAGCCANHRRGRALRFGMHVVEGDDQGAGDDAAGDEPQFDDNGGFDCDACDCV